MNVMTTKIKCTKNAPEEVAIQLQSGTTGFSYHKWVTSQSCKPGDWIVKNAFDMYTVDENSFSRSYRAASLSCHRIFSPVRASMVGLGCTNESKEGFTQCQAGTTVALMTSKNEMVMRLLLQVHSKQCMKQPNE